MFIKLIGSNHDKVTDIYHFYFHNTETNWYYDMACKNAFGTKDMYLRTFSMTDEEFKALAGDRLA